MRLLHNRGEFLAGLLRALHDLVFPPVCLFCEQRLNSSLPPLFCRSCLQDITPIVSPLCVCCGAPFPGGEDHMCGSCLSAPPAFDRCRSLFYYEPPLSSLLVQLKFTGRTAVLPSLAVLARQRMTAGLLSDPDVIIPVPLHPHRLRARGFNQAVLVARRLFPNKTSCVDVRTLIRHKATRPQTQLKGKERRTNLAASFSLTAEGAIQGKKILLVDDVYTTGSTVLACAQVLRQAEPETIQVLTVARSVPGRLSLKVSSQLANHQW
ncbi:MAG: amidophosphoribosyltransferase [Desulfobulbus propionicus]|nr:MAG: amidophosphoribosyltransferase [Desulfobulbus propionicus]